MYTGEVFRLRKLMPTSMAHDFNIHIMDFDPGEYLNVKEVHYNQHGLWMRKVRMLLCNFVVVRRRDKVCVSVARYIIILSQFFCIDVALLSTGTRHLSTWRKLVSCG